MLVVPGPGAGSILSELQSAGISASGRPLRGRERASLALEVSPPRVGRTSRNSSGARAAAKHSKKVSGGLAMSWVARWRRRERLVVWMQNSKKRGRPVKASKAHKVVWPEWVCTSSRRRVAGVV